MCGIFGTIVPTRYAIESPWISSMVKQISPRGSQGLGMWMGTKTMGLTFKALSTGNPLHTLIGPLSGPISKSSIILGHTRAPTGENTPLIEHLHPYAIPNFVFAHNGLILDWERQSETSLLHPEDPYVDSMVVLRTLESFLTEGRRTIAEAIQLTAQSFEGQQACWLLHLPTRDVYLWRVMSPLVVARYNHGVLFASEMPEFSGNLRTMPQGVVYKIAYTPEAKDILIDEVGSFQYSSPYEVTA